MVTLVLFHHPLIGFPFVPVASQRPNSRIAARLRGLRGSTWAGAVPGLWQGCSMLSRAGGSPSTPSWARLGRASCQTAPAYSWSRSATTRPSPPSSLWGLVWPLPPPPPLGLLGDCGGRIRGWVMDRHYIILRTVGPGCGGES